MTEKIVIFSSRCLLREITEVKKKKKKWFFCAERSYSNLTFCLEKARYFGYLKNCHWCQCHMVHILTILYSSNFPLRCGYDQPHVLKRKNSRQGENRCANRCDYPVQTSASRCPTLKYQTWKVLLMVGILNSKPELCRNQLFCLCECPVLARLHDSAFISFPSPLGSRNK